MAENEIAWNETLILHNIYSKLTKIPLMLIVQADMITSWCNNP